MDSWDIVFHRPQAHVYRDLLSGRNVVLSAPTSFGKSLIVDAIIASEVYKNLLIIVPTIALIDETRRRLSRFRDRYKIISHVMQERGGRNIFVLTQERVLEMKDLDLVEFFVLDECYKLSPGRTDDDRCYLLNHALYKLIKKNKKFYMLSPLINGIVDDAEVRLDYSFYKETYHTVVSRIHRLRLGGDPLATLAGLCRTLTEPTIIFCSSPNRAAIIARNLLSNGLGEPEEALQYAAEWIARHYHPQWHVAQALSQGIGVHHGRIPRALAQYIVRSFNAGYVKYLICTSTLIEGVNTKAKNIVIYDDKIDKKKYDMFTFNNIKGRSGRMFEHFVGHVYVFHEPPQQELPLVDVPAITQPETAPTSLLIQIDDDDLADRSKERLRDYEEQDVLSYDVLKKNVGIDLDRQISLAEELLADLRGYYSLLYWNGIPNWDQLHFACNLIWKHFDGAKIGAGSISNVRHLATMLNKLRSRPTIRALIDNQLQYSDDADHAVGRILDFLRLWANFQFPRLLRALDRIQKYLLRQLGLAPGDYESYASQVESLFLDPTLLALDEYGVPLQLATHLAPNLRPRGNLDEVLERLKELDINALELDVFEYEILDDVRKYI